MFIFQSYKFVYGLFQATSVADGADCRALNTVLGLTITL